MRRQTRVLILQRDGFRCKFCGATSEETRLQVDHIMPQARGGTDSLDNLATLCEACNSGKNDLWLGNYAALVMRGTVPQPPRRQPLTPPIEYARDALLQVLGHLVDSGVNELAAPAFAHAIEVTRRSGSNELFEPLAFPTLLPAIKEAISNAVLIVDGDSFRILGKPKDFVAGWRNSADESFATAPILRWQSPAVRVEMIGHDYRIAIDVYCSNEGPRDSNARIQAFDAELVGWGHLDFEEFQQGTTIYSVHNTINNRFLMKIRQPSTGAYSYGLQDLTWSVVYTDDAMRPYLTIARVKVEVVGLGAARIVEQSLDETTAAARFRHYMRAAPPHLTKWSA